MELIKLIEDEHYWKIDDTIVIKHHVDFSFDTNFLSELEISTLIFSNSTDLECCINYDNKYGMLSIFNNLIEIPNCIRNLYFGYCFNKIILLPNSIKKLEFGERFDRIINLPDSLESLTFGSNFDQDIVLPNSLKNLIFGTNFDTVIRLPEMLENLIFGNSFNKVVELPNSLKNLIFGNLFNKVIILPDSLEYLEFGRNFNKQISYPHNLINVKFGINFSSFAELFNVKILTINNYNKNLMNNLPNSLELLIFDTDFDGIKMSRQMELDHSLNNLPSSIKHIEFLNNRFANGFDLVGLPDSVESIILCADFVGKIKPLPKKLKKITCKKHYKFIGDFENLIVEYL